MPKVLISDPMDEIAEKILLSNNIEVDVITNFTPDELNQNINFIKYIILRPFSWKVDSSLEEGSKLRFYTNFFLSDFKREIKTKKFNETDINDLKVSDNEIDDDNINKKTLLGG